MPGPRQRDIKTYFTLQSQPAVVPTNPEPAVGQTLCPPANTSIYNSATQNTIPFVPAEIPAKPAAIIPPPKEVSNATAKAAKTPKDSTNKEMVNSNNELRKQLEQIKVVKDQAEMKVSSESLLLIFFFISFMILFSIASKNGI
jgi:outer membrane biosynthesis protein TonB